MGDARWLKADGSSTALDEVAEQLLTAAEQVTTLAPISATWPGFDSTCAYGVLARIAESRQGSGWEFVGRKIGFTNRTIWERYGVDRPFWAHIWSETVVRARSSQASVSLGSFVQPRIEPEVVFKLSGPVPLTRDPSEIVSSVDWMAPGFEIVQCHFPNWQFTNADCTAAFGLHGALVIGEPVAVSDANRDRVVAALSTFEATLSRNGAIVDRGTGANVLDSPALALGHLAELVAGQPEAPPLAAGEIVTTGTITDAWPIESGDVWESDYGALGLDGLTVSFA